VFVYFIGFLLFTGFASKIESLALHWPIFLLAAGLLLLRTWWFVLRQLKRATPDSEMELIYEDAAAKEVQTLDILGVG
jgi:type III secretory pathway component EscT